MSDWVSLKDALGLTLRPIDVWPGKPRYDRSLSPFSAPFKDTLAKLKRELSMLNARNIVFQVALREQDFRLDGLPRADARATHPGVILAFTSKHGPLRLIFDGFTKWQDNLRAICLHLENLRHAGLYGVGTDGQQYKGWAALPAPEPDGFATAEEAARWLTEVSGYVVSLPISSVGLDIAYRHAARKLHPDAGGNHEAFVKLQKAKELLG